MKLRADGRARGGIRTVLLLWSGAAFAAPAGCDGRIVLVAEETDDAGTMESDGPDDVAVDDVGDDDEEFAADSDGDADADVGPPCPVWAVPRTTGGVEDGSADHPFGGLQRAVDGRGSCDHIILGDSSTYHPFDAGVDIVLDAGRSLTIEGVTPSPPAELDAHGGIGLFVTGDGTLTLHHLAVRNGHADTGGCLNAQVRELQLDDTEWSGCRAASTGGAVWVWAERTSVLHSSFIDNAADEGVEGGEAGGLRIDGPRDAASILVDRSHFERNIAGRTGAVMVSAQTEDCFVQNCVFVRNEASSGAGALEMQAGQISHSRFQENGPGLEAPAVAVVGTPTSRVVQTLFIDNHVGRGASALVISWGVVNNNLFVRNVCRNALGSDWCTAAGWVRDGGPDVRNNTFVDNESEAGIAHLSFDAAFGRGHSNLFVGGVGHAAVGTDFPAWGASAIQDYNAVWMAPDLAWGEGVQTGEGNIEADPLFVASDDFHLGEGSACLDAGDPDPTLLDVDGSRNDVGAFGGPEGDWVPLPEGGAP
jgi:hypothetical protein